MSHAAAHAYLDTANWIDLAAGQVPSQGRFEAAVRAGRVLPVLSITHVEDLAQCDSAKSDPAVGYAEALAATGNMRWIRRAPDIVSCEAVNLRRRYLGKRAMDPAGISRSSHAMVPLLARATWRGRMPVLSLTEWVRAYRADPDLQVVRDAHAEAKQWFKDYKRPRDARAPLLSTDPSRLLDRLQDRFVEMVLRRMPKRVRSGTLDLTPASRSPEFLDFVRRSDPWDSPALAFALAYEQGRFEAGSKKDMKTDFEDWFHCAQAAYCDIAFVDKTTYSHLDAGGAKDRIHRFRKNAEFATWVGSLLP